MPNDQTRAELGNLRDYLVEHMDEFIAPAPGQIGTLAKSLERACIVWEEMRHPPDDDSVFLADVEAAQRERLANALQAVHREMRCIIDGITEIEKRPLSLRKQRMQFKELERQSRPSTGIGA
jgi:hypothetical protein